MVIRKANPLIFFICFIGFAGNNLFGQEQRIADSLFKVYKQENLSDSIKMVLLPDLSFNEVRDLLKGLHYAEEMITLSEKLGNYDHLRIAYYLKGTKKRALGEIDEALAAYIKSIEIAKKIKNLAGEGEGYGAMADTYTIAKNYPNAWHYYQKGIFTLRKSPNDSLSLASLLSNAGDAFRQSGQYDSAFIYLNEAKEIFERLNYSVGKGYCLGNMGMVYASIGNNKLAEWNINAAISILEGNQDYYPICEFLISMADVYLDKGDKNAALNYTLRSFQLAEQQGLKEQVSGASLKLSEIYEKEGKDADALSYYKKHIAYRDSINNMLSIQKMYDQRIDFELSQKQVEVNILNAQKRNQKGLVISLIIILFLASIILATLLRNNKNKQKAYKVLNLQKQETDLQKAKAEDALSELQLTQKQLIQSAKMASLGELTAGIAHEIKNPLNFVNNFSELSIELLNELRDGIMKKLTAADKAEAELILNDIDDNLKKILNHGIRADAIVKSMLQHSRPSSGKKELTDINALAGEYLRLSYNGLSAKDKLDIHFSTVFDESILKMEVIRQELGSVLLNIYNNAFYSVISKKEQITDNYQPIVSLATKKVGSMVEISIRDNGTGIPQNVVDKIFQPFFTTKPTGQGTGLGLSLSYDIIKAHGGEFKVETKEGEFAEFIIQLPTGQNHDKLS